MRRSIILILIAAGLVVAACQSGVQAPAGGAAGSATLSPEAGADSQLPTLMVASHDSFAVSDPVVKAFEDANHVKLQFLTLGDAGAALNKMILSKDAPLADVFFGVDNTFLSRALKAGIFEPYTSPLLDKVPSDFKLDAEHQLTPIDFGFVNLNVDRQWFAAKGLALPQSLEDLAKPEYKGLLVVMNPATSSPGLAFLLTTIGHFGQDKYLDYWKALRANDTLVSDDWNDAYFNQFSVGSAGKGTRPLVVSYTTSPPADVVYATDGRTVPASTNFDAPQSAFRQIEFAGVLKGAKQPALAQRFIDFMLDRTFQEDIPLQMFVYPVNPDAKLPDLFTKFAIAPADPVVVAPAAIDANRENWIQAWTEVMLH
jgi:thiamine transport system substrate-binding protein